MHRKLFPLFIFLFLTVACSSPLIADLVTQPGGVLFKDDFSDTSSGWVRSTVHPDYNLRSGSVIDYAGDGYRIFANTANDFYWSNPGLSFEDVRVEVDATRVAGPEINQIGLLCRYRDENNFYFFIVSSDGYYAIGKFMDEEISLLGNAQMQRSKAVNAGDTVNHLRADCVGKTLTFYINDQPVGIVEDADLTSGDVGLLAGAFDDAGVDVRFDNFVVYKP